MSADIEVTPGSEKSNGGTGYPNRRAHGRMKPPRHASVWKPSPCSRAVSDSASIGSIVPCGNAGAEPTRAIVSLVMAARILATSARKSRPTGTRINLMPK